MVNKMTATTRTDDAGQTTISREPVLQVRDLRVQFDTAVGVVNAVNGASFDVYPGETLGIVGESGSGKSVTSMAIMGLLESPSGRVCGGQILFEGTDLVTASKSALRGIRGSGIGMVFQDPMTSLNPSITVGGQVVEALRLGDRTMSRAAARAETVRLLGVVGIPDPEARARQFPFQFSGGMRQRAMIAMAIANRPKVLIADEPTTALDVTIQAQILEVLKKAQGETGAATIMITHDLGVIAETADRVAVMYAGRIVEAGTVEQVFANPRHPYTVGLMNSRPQIDERRGRLRAIEGQPPSAAALPSGCTFHPRCVLSQGRTRCATELPKLRSLGADVDHPTACHFAEEVHQLPLMIAGGMRSEAAEPVAADPTAADPVNPASGGAGLAKAPVLQVRNLVVEFPIRRGLFSRRVGAVHAVDGVDLEVGPG
jgi:peptide/nickel transport system ATP-binding protein